MERYYGANQLLTTPPVPTPDPTNKYPTIGDSGTGIPATTADAYWAYMLVEEIYNLLVDAGITPSISNLAQLKEAVDAKISAATGTLAIEDSSAIQNQKFSYAADTGAADAYVITLSPAPSAYAAGQRFAFKATNTNTTTSTINVNSLGVKTIKKDGGANSLISGDIVANQIVELEYDGTNFQMVSPFPANPSAASGSSLVLLGTASPSAASTVDLTSVVTSTYERYLITFDDLVPSLFIGHACCFFFRC